MCGIGGLLFSTENRAALGRKMSAINALQRHRGPDGQFFLVLDQHAFCHQRLALLDAEGGQQPFRDREGRYIMVYNGELYNYLELKKKLNGKYQFVTNSDTEVVLAAFIVWGEACLQQFNGMFAFLIWDTHTATAFAARDPLGVKPFVYHQHLGTFMFASELKALLSVVNMQLEIDPYLLAEYVIAPYFSGGSSQAIFKNIHYLEPGSSLRIDGQGIYLQKYYSFNWKRTAANERELVASTAQALEESVQQSLRGDTPAGIFLSGGLDSSLIAAIAAQHAKEAPAAFSIAFDKHADIYFDPATIVNSDDLPFAAALAKQLALPFHKVTPQDNSLTHTLIQLAEINDRIPAWEQEFSQHFLARAAATQLKVVLVGDAADETHYGYFFLLNAAINRSPMSLLNLFGGEKRMDLLAPPLRQHLQSLSYFDELYQGVAKQAGFDFSKGGEESILAMSALVNRRWLGRLLHNGDIHTMHYGVEARVPFANRNLLDVASQVSPQLGFKNEVEKSILRQAAAKWLPPHYCSRKKSALPRDPRLGKAYQSILRTLLVGENGFIDAFLYRPALAALCDLEAISENDRMQLFNMICLIYWGRRYAK